MSRSSLFSSHLRRSFSLVLAVLAGSIIFARAEAPGQVALATSVQPVAPTASANLHDPYLSRATLTAGEKSAPINFEVALKMHNLAELQARVAQGQRISPQEMAAKYEPADADYQRIATWLTAEGFAITHEDKHHVGIFVRGSVDQVQQSMNVSFGRVAFRNQEFTSAITAPNVPAWMSPLVVGLNGLQPHLRPHKHIIKRAATPDASGGGADYKPSQIAAAYNATSLYTSNISGAGQTIAIVIDTFPATSDLTLFWQKVGVAQSLSNIQFIQAVPGQLEPPSGEETLDTEWASGMAPGAHVRVYAATDLADNDLDQTYSTVLDDVTSHPELNIHQMTMSFGEGEHYTSQSQVDTDDQYFSELAAAGVTIFASTGDSGSTPDADGGDSGPLQAETPATDPNVTAVGGTTLMLSASNTVTSETVWDTGEGSGGAGGGGTSIYFSRPSWQTGQGVANVARQTPDISSSADPNYGAITYLDGQLNPVGGTSWSSPTCAALCALMNEARANAGLGTLGLLGPFIYPQIGTTSLRDIVIGSNATRNSGGKFAATIGYDEASGVGTPLMQALTEAVTSSSSLVGVTPSAPVVEVTPNQNATFTIAVSGSTASFQWQEMPIGSSSWTNLGDGGSVSGSTTSSLTITSVTAAMSGDQFQCLVTLSSSTVTTTPSVLVVDRPFEVSTFAGDAGTTGLHDGTGTSAQFNFPSAIAVDRSGNVYVADFSNNQIREISPTGVVSTPFGSTNGAAGSSNGSGNSARFDNPNAVAIDPSGNIFVADTGNNLIRKITNGTVSTFASGFNAPEGITTDSSGSVYVADTGNDIIRKISPAGVVSILAGQDRTEGFQDGNATGTAEFNAPVGVAVDSNGNVYVADFGNSCVRKIAGATVTTVAGQGGQSGYLDGLGANSLFDAPTGVCVDPLNNVYITDALVPSFGSNTAGNDLIRKLSTTGVVSTLAGNPGSVGTSNGLGTAAEFDSVQAIAYAAGTFYIADTYNQTIRQGTPSGKLAATVTLGNLAATYNGSAQPATTATNPSGLTVVVTYNGSTTPPTNVGSYSVVATINDANYSGNATGTLIISKASATVALGNLNFNYTGTAHPVTATTTPSGLAVSFTYNGSTNAPTATGNYTVVGTILSSNYQGSATGTEVITGGIATITFGNLNFNYTGGIHAATATVLPSGLSVTFTYNGSSAAPGAVGSYTVVATVTSPNYTGTATSTLVINPIVPTVTTGAASAITATSATLGATSDPETSDTTVSFQYGPTTAYGSTSASADIGSGSTSVATTESIAVPGLTTATVYHYRAVATNTAGTVFGADKTFTALAEPSIVTGAAASLSATGAEVNLSVNPDGLATTVYLMYGTTTNFGNTTTSQVLGAGKTPVNAFLLFPNLAANTTYFYEVVMVNSAGTFFGPQQQFTTLGFDTTLIAASGGAAPGASTFAEFGSPIVNALDGVAFNSTLTVGSGMIAATDDAIFADTTGGTLALVAQIGTSAPGTSANFLMLSDPVYNDSAAVAFRGTLKVVSGEATNTTAAGIWSNSGGTLSLIARQGSAAAGTGSTFSTFTALGLTASAGPVFYATLNNGGNVTSTNNAGIWEGNTAQTLALQQGEAIGGKTVSKLTFMPVETIVNGQTRSFNASGDLVCAATFSDRTTGFVVSIGGAPQLGRVSGQPADTIAGATYATFGNAAINDNDHLAYAATIAGTGVTRTNSAGIWADNSGGTRTLVARTGTANAPGTTAMFTALSDPVFNNNEAVAFRGTLQVGSGQATSTTSSGIWATGGNASSLALIAQQGTAAPGCPAGATFATFTGLALPDVSGPVILGTLNTSSTAGVTSSNNTGIWAVENNQLQLIVRTGDILNGKTVTALQFLPSPAIVNGQDRSFSAATGDLVYLATFSDKSTAIFNVVFP
jgi:kumamolisin